MEAPSRPTRDDAWEIAICNLADELFPERDQNDKNYQIATLKKWSRGDSTMEKLRILDDAGWTVDDEMLEAVQGFSCELEFEQLVKKWVEDFGVTAPLPVGEIVSFQHIVVKTGWREVTGEIIRVDHETAVYTVFCEELGHIREGEGCGTLGLCINAEKIQDGIGFAPIVQPLGFSLQCDGVA